jgi:hypothetical protein
MLHPDGLDAASLAGARIFSGTSGRPDYGMADRVQTDVP